MKKLCSLIASLLFAMTTPVVANAFAPSCSSPVPLVGEPQGKSRWFDVTVQDGVPIVEVVSGLESPLGLKLDDHWKKSEHEFNIELSAKQLDALRCEKEISQVAYAPSRSRGKPAKRQLIERVVVLFLTLTEDGHVKDVKIQKSSGVPSLDEAARQQALNFKSPKKKNGEPFKSDGKLPVIFRLEELAP